MKKLVWKVHITASDVNAGGTVSGGRIFDMADVSAYTLINEKFTSIRPDLSVVTNSANVKFIAPAWAYGFIESFAEVIEVTPGKINILVTMNFRQNKDLDWYTCFEGTFSFTCLNAKTRKVYKLTKEEMNEIQS